VHQRGFDRVLQAVLGELEILEDRDQERQQPAAVMADDRFDRRRDAVRRCRFLARAYCWKTWIGRTSTEPQVAVGIMAA
jgi:hypothetical protein